MHIWWSTIYIKIIGDAAGLLIAEQLTELVGGSISTEASFSKHSEEAGDGFGLVDFEQAVALQVSMRDCWAIAAWSSSTML